MNKVHFVSFHSSGQMKKNLVICFVIFSLMILSSMISAQEDLTSPLPENLTSFTPEDLTELNKISSAANPENWNDLMETWKQNFLSSEIISEINNFFTNINIVFLVLFGESYSLSLLLYFVIFLWIFFLIKISGALSATLFSKGVSFLISFGLTIILAQLNLFSAISGFFVKLISMPETPWIGILIFVGINVFLVFIGMIEKLIEKKIVANKKILEEEKAKLNRNVLDTYVSGIKEGFNE